MASRYLIYALSDPRTGDVRYVGKSCRGLRRARSHLCPSNLAKDGDTHKAHWIKELLALGLKPEIRILEELLSVEGLGEAEVFWISYWKSIGARLTNLTDGGDGAPGLPCSEKRKMNISRSRGGRPFCDNNGNVYQTLSDAVSKLGVNVACLVSVLKGKFHQTRGYSFRYLKEGETEPQPWLVEKNSILERKNRSRGGGGRAVVDVATGIEYVSVSVAAEAMGRNPNNLHKHLRGRQKTF